MDDLLAAVESRFAVTGGETPGWPAPRPPAAAPLEEEHSRILDPAKYAISPARLRAWADVLVLRGLMTEVDVDPTSAASMTAERVPDRVVRWVPVRPAGVALTFAFHTMEGVADAVVEVGVGESPTWVDRVPDCGCDACDDGSAALLDQLDATVETVVSGRFVHVSGPDGTMWTTRDGARGNGDVDLDRLLSGAAPAPDEVVLRGPAWW